MRAAFLSLFAAMMVCGAAAVADQDTGEQDTHDKDRAQESNQANVDDAEITTRVKTALMGNDSVKAREIEVETREGVVQLSGFVDNQDAIEAAVMAATQVEGVEEVRNDLAIQESEPSIGQAVDDTVIAAKVKADLIGDEDLATARDVNVEVSNGVVQLSGFVASVEQKNRAADVASGVDGVKDVRNNIALAKN